MYKFHFHSIDGEHKASYDTLDDFEREWTAGRAASFEGGTYTTCDGITLIYPDNDATLLAVRQRYDALREMEQNPISRIQTDIFNTVGVDKEALTSLQKANDPQATVQTQYGLARLVRDKQMLSCRQALAESIVKMTKDKSPASVHGVILVRDDLNGQTLVVDTLSEPISLDQVLGRPTVPAMTLDVGCELFEGFNDDGVYADSKISGDVMVVSQLEVNVKALEDNYREFYVNPRGFSNSQHSPMDAYALKAKVEQNYETKGFDVLIEKETGDLATAVELNQTTTTALGSLNNGLFIEQDNETVFVKHGQTLMLDKSTMTVSVHDGGAPNNYRAPQDNWMDFEEPAL